MLKILSLDPSGTGTTGICLINGSQITFKEFKSKVWKEHLTYLAQLNKTFQPQVILFEHTNYINSRGKDMTGLLKLLGALECLPLDHIESLPVHQVKELSKQLFKGTKKLPEIEFKPGRGKG
ncbi:14224_t:CDS:1 [Funneliformis geosporum]|nr:14224_t:CDS:1 [Funneliformis geosporum]